jgi:tRNA(Leu) C34 or U34 (ribose-2'-O)-methylase TrmL
MNRIIYGKDAKPYGNAPAVILSNPKYPHNVGAALRACSCYGIEQLWFTGDRVSKQIELEKRLPREERMRGYKQVELISFDYPFDAFEGGTTFVGVEIVPGAENIFDFEHPQDAVYVFGPEDGSIPKSYRGLCHRFVRIPSHFCLNLSAAVYTILYDRALKQHLGGGGLPFIDKGSFECDLERDFVDK